MNDYYLNFIKQKLKKDILMRFSPEYHSHLSDEIDNYFLTHPIEFKDIQKEKQLHVSRPEEKYKCKKNRCKARIWNEGNERQCSRNALDHGFCKTHFENGAEEWWLGVITEPRPERPVHPDGRVHTWIN